jgi:hypothetical protein
MWRKWGNGILNLIRRHLPRKAVATQEHNTISMLELGTLKCVAAMQPMTMMTMCKTYPLYERSLA